MGLSSPKGIVIYPPPMGLSSSTLTLPRSQWGGGGVKIWILFSIGPEDSPLIKLSL